MRDLRIGFCGHAKIDVEVSHDPLNISLRSQIRFYPSTADQAVALCPCIAGIGMPERIVLTISLACLEPLQPSEFAPQVLFQVFDLPTPLLTSGQQFHAPVLRFQ